MPEQLTRHPEVTLEVLKSGPAACGSGAPQEILRTCPPARFCKLPGGELCIYGLPEAGSMTQVTAADWQALAGVARPAVQASSAADAATALAPVALGLVAGLVIGAGLAWWLRR